LQEAVNGFFLTGPNITQDWRDLSHWGMLGYLKGADADCQEACNLTGSLQGRWEEPEAAP